MQDFVHKQTIFSINMRILEFHIVSMKTKEGP